MVLLIDNDDDFRIGLAENLRDDGYAVDDYSGPAQLPPLEQLTGVDVVVTDYQMPGEDGLAFAERLHRVHPQLPVVIVTAYSTAHLEGAVRARSFLRLQQKPVDYRQLSGLLSELASVPR